MKYCSMDLFTAWEKLGYSPVEIFKAINSVPKNQRVKVVQDFLEQARKSAKRIMASNHPDTGGDVKKFIIASTAVQVIEINTKEFERKMKLSISESEAKNSKKVFIVKE